MSNSTKTWNRLFARDFDILGISFFNNHEHN